MGTFSCARTAAHFCLKLATLAFPPFLGAFAFGSGCKVRPAWLLTMTTRYLIAPPLSISSAHDFPSTVHNWTVHVSDNIIETGDSQVDSRSKSKTHPSSAYILLSRVGTDVSHHFQSAGSFPNFFPDAVTMSVESRSNAAIFLLLLVVSPSVPFPSSLGPSGSKRPTSKVGGAPSTPRSVHVVRSLGFCDVGVKKLATAPWEIVLWALRFIGGGEMGFPPALRLLVVGLRGDGGFGILSVVERGCRVDEKKLPQTMRRRRGGEMENL